MDNLTEEEIKEIAQQLRCPDGAVGIEVSDTMRESNREMTLKTLDALPFKGGDSVLEIGPAACGHLDHILSKAADIKYCGLDISELMIREAEKAHSPHINKGTVSFHLYNGTESFPFADDTFDKVITVNTIYFWENPQKLLSEVGRVMKPESLFSVCFGDASFMKKLPFTRYGFTLYSPGKVEELLSKNGFDHIKTRRCSDIVKAKTGETVERVFYLTTGEAVKTE